MLPIFFLVTLPDTDDRPAIIAPLVAPAEQRRRDALATFGLGVYRHRSERLLDAIKLLEEARTIDPQAAGPARALIPLYMSFAREEEAIAAAQHVLKIVPGDAQTAIRYAGLMRAIDRTTDGLTALAAAAEANSAPPEDLDALLEEWAKLRKVTGDATGAATVRAQHAALLRTHQARFYRNATYDRDSFAERLGETLEALGDLHVERKAWQPAAQAFRDSRTAFAEGLSGTVQAKATRLHKKTADLFEAQGLPNEALEALTAYLRTKPAEAEPYERLITLLDRLKKSEQILPLLQRLAESAPDVLSVQRIYAERLAHDPAMRPKAIDQLRKLTVKFPSAEAYRGLFMVWIADGNASAVVEFTDRTCNRFDDQAGDPIDREAARTRGRVLYELLRNEPEIVRAMLPEARKRALAGKYGELSATFFALLADDHRDWPTAIDLYRAALATAKEVNRPQIYGSLLHSLFVECRHAEIVNICREVKDGPIEMMKHTEAAALSLLGRHKEAIDAIDAAIKAASESSRLRTLCGKIGVLAAADRMAEAEKLADELLKEFVQQEEILTIRKALVRAYAEAMATEKLEAEYRKILDLSPRDSTANNGLGYSWADRNTNLDAAETHIRYAIESHRLENALRPEGKRDHGSYTDSLGWVLYRKGKFTEAIEELEKAAKSREGERSPEVWDHLGDAYLAAGKADAAKDAFRKALLYAERDALFVKSGRPAKVKAKLGT